MVSLGRKVRDKVTGFTGIATRRIESLYGSTQVLVESPVAEIDEAPTEVVASSSYGGPMTMKVGRLAMGELQNHWFEENRLTDA
jgi:hypothetical protein